MGRGEVTRQDIAIVLLIVFLGVALRVLFALHAPISADESVYTNRALGFLGAKAISSIDQAPLWFAITDLFFTFFGSSDLIARLLPILASAGLIALLYLMGTSIYSRRAGIIAAMLFAFSGFSISQTAEMDIVMTFFMLLSIWLFILAFRSKERTFLLLTGAFLINGIAVAFKSTAILVFPIYLIFLAMHHKRLLKDKYILRIAGLGFASVWGLLPILLYNVLLRATRGTYDLIIVAFLQDVSTTPYAGLALPGFSLGNIIPDLAAIRYMFTHDALLLTAAVVAVALFARRIKHFPFLVSLFGLQLLFVLGSTGLAKHYVNLVPFLALFAAAGADLALPKKNTWAIPVGGAVFLVFCLIISSSILTASGRSLVRAYVQDDVSDDALLVVDSRIYTNVAFWLGNDKHVILSHEFFRLVDAYKEGPTALEEIVYVSCTSGDCGWGRALPPEMDQMDGALRQNLALDRILKGNDEEYAVYRATVQIPAQVKQDAYLTNNFYMHSLRWRVPEGSLDHFQLSGGLLTVRNLGLVVLWINMLIALALLIVPWVLLAKPVE